MFLSGILALFSFLLCIGLGIFTIFRNPRNPANIGFMLGLLAVAAHEFGSMLVFLFDGAFRTIGVKATIVSEVLLPIAWLPFSSAFAKADQKNVLSSQRPTFALCAVASAFFLYSINSSEFIKVVEPSAFLNDGRLYDSGPIGTYFLLYLILGLILNLIHLENTLRSSKGPKRWQIKYVIFGVGAILAFFIYSASQALLFSSVKEGMLPLTSAVIIISVSIMAVFIVRHRLLDVDIFISRYVIYNSLTVLIIGVYFIIVGIIAHGVKFFGIPFDNFFSTLFIFVALLLLIMSFFTVSLKRKFQLLINRHFYKHKYEFRDKWMETIEKISPKRQVDDIEATLKELIGIDMCAKPVFTWVYDQMSKSFLSGDPDVPEGLRRLSADFPFIALLRQHDRPFLKEMLEGQNGALDAEVSRIFSGTGTILCSPMVAGHELIGFVMQGPDMSGEPYRQDDFELLKAITTQAAVQIKNIMLSQDIMNIREVEAFNKLSTFVMHDLKNLTNSLSLVSQNAKFNMDNPEFQKDALKTIDGTVQRMKKLIDRLSNLPKELEIKKTSVDLHGFVQEIIKTMPSSSSKPVDIINEIERPFFIQIDPEAMEMVFINIILNAREAVPANGKVTITGTLADRFAIVRISDNGSGMTEEFLRKDLFKPFKTTRKNGLGIGLFQCKSIIEAHGGIIGVQSELGKGTVFSLSIPLEPLQKA